MRVNILKNQQKWPMIGPKNIDKSLYKKALFFSEILRNLTDQPSLVRGEIFNRLQQR